MGRHSPAGSPERPVDGLEAGAWDTFAGRKPYGQGNQLEDTMIGFIIGLLIIGLIAGAVARLLVPGKQEMSVPMTMLIGVIGSFVGGFLGALIFGKDIDDGFFQASGIIGSIIGAIIVLLIWQKLGSRATIRS